MNYEDMTDEEVNFEVFHKLSDDVWDRQLSSKVWNLLSDKYDYCNDPSEAWKIILENKISIVPTMGWWRARPEQTAWAEQYDDNPLRAAMIVFLMMNEKD